MKEYKIITDSCCDFTLAQAKKLDVAVMPMEVILDDGTKYSGFDTDLTAFYKKLREKHTAQTSAVNLNTCLETFETYLKQGMDIIYVGLSAGISGTYGTCKIAASELSAKYPDQKIYLVNSHTGSIGQGLLIYLAVQKKREGASCHDVYAYLKDLRKRIQTHFTLNDLFFLKRGGRISPATAILGSVLNLKPLLHASKEGTLTVIGKARGRRNALLSLVDAMGALMRDPTGTTVAIGHTDCPDDADFLRTMILARWNVKEILVSEMGTTIGSHCGPDTVALFFLADPDMIPEENEKA